MMIASASTGKPACGPRTSAPPTQVGNRLNKTDLNNRGDAERHDEFSDVTLSLRDADPGHVNERGAK